MMQQPQKPSSIVLRSAAASSSGKVAPCVRNAVHDYAAKHHGIISVRDADAVPTNANTLRSLAHRGMLTRVTHGVYRLSVTPLEGLTKLMAYCRWAPLDDWMLTGGIARWLYLESAADPTGWERQRLSVTLATESGYKPNRSRVIPREIRFRGFKDEVAIPYQAFAVEKPASLLAELAMRTAEQEFGPSTWRMGGDYTEDFRQECEAFRQRDLIHRYEDFLVANFFEQARRHFHACLVKGMSAEERAEGGRYLWNCLAELQRTEAPPLTSGAESAHRQASAA